MFVQPRLKRHCPESARRGLEWSLCAERACACTCAYACVCTKLRLSSICCACWHLSFPEATDLWTAAALQLDGTHASSNFLRGKPKAKGQQKMKQPGRPCSKGCTVDALAISPATLPYLDPVSVQYVQNTCNTSPPPASGCEPCPHCHTNFCSPPTTQTNRRGIVGHKPWPPTSPKPHRKHHHRTAQHSHPPIPNVPTNCQHKLLQQPSKAVGQGQEGQHAVLWGHAEAWQEG